MQPPAHSVLRVSCLLAFLLSSSMAAASINAPKGPFRVVGNTLVDAQGAPFLIHGTQTTPFHLRSAIYDARSGKDFGPHSATSLSAIHLRMNMNTVRVAVDIAEADQPGFFNRLKALVVSINQNDLIVVLAASDPSTPMPSARVLAFWKQCAPEFKEFPNVLFEAFDRPSPSGILSLEEDVHSPAGWNFWRNGGALRDGTRVFGMEDAVRAIRATGARQPVVLPSWNDAKLFEGFNPAVLEAESDVLYEVSPRYEDKRTVEDRDRQFGFLAAGAPLIANDWDLHLDDPQACVSIPADPDAATRLVLDNIAYFDAHRISWTASTYEVGKLLQDNVNLLPTKLEGGIVCGDKPHTPAGMGRLILSRMFGTDEGKLVVVNVSGGAVLPRGGYSIAYGRIMAERDLAGSQTLPPYRLGNLSVDITDSQKVTRPARVSWTSAGWGSLNFIVPEASATGAGSLTIKRADGTRDTAKIQIAAAAPGLFTMLNCQGPAVGVFTQATRTGKVIASSAISKCSNYTCSTLEIPVARSTRTRVKLVASGFRNAPLASQIDITVAGVRVTVVSYKPASAAGVDELIVEIPETLSGIGETDLICHVNGVLANVVRIAIGGSSIS